MNPTITKIDNNHLQLNKSTVQAVTYQYEEILSNKAQLLIQKQNIESQLLDIDAILAQCVVLGIKEKVITPAVGESASNVGFK